MKGKGTQAEACATDAFSYILGREIVMSTTPSPATSSASAQTGSQSIGLYVELGGAGAFIAGAILSLHHYAIGVCFIAGAAAFYVGKKLRGA
jgi:hypothetical protein